MRIKRHAMFQLRQTQSVCSQLNGCFCMALNEQALQHWHKHTQTNTNGLRLQRKARSILAADFYILKTHSHVPIAECVEQNGHNDSGCFFGFCGKNQIVIAISFISNWSFKSMEFKFRFTKCISLLVILLHSIKSAYSLHFRLHEPTKSTSLTVYIWSNDYDVLTVCLLTQ